MKQNISLFQKILINSYGMLNRSGILENDLVKMLSIMGYFAYKRWHEDPFPHVIRKYPEWFAGGHVVDIGANVGFTALVFSKVLSPGYKVYAFEPDSSNFRWLQKMIRWYNASDKIVPIHAAVGAADGEIELWHNKDHFADHRIVTGRFRNSGIHSQEISSVEIRSIDSFVQSEKLNLTFIKIDVQGYELPVCQGMGNVMATFPDLTIVLEYAPECMLDLGFEPNEILTFFRDKQYLLYMLGRKGNLELTDNRTVEAKADMQGYVDLVISRKNLLIHDA